MQHQRCNTPRCPRCRRCLLSVLGQMLSEGKIAVPRPPCTLIVSQEVSLAKSRKPPGTCPACPMGAMILAAGCCYISGCSFLPPIPHMHCSCHTRSPAGG